MKSFIVILWFVIIIVAIMAFGCTKEIIIPQKEYVYIKVPGKDSTIVIRKDSISYMLRYLVKDSIVTLPGVEVPVYIDRIVYKTDTLTIVKHHYDDTLYIFYHRPVHTVPDRYKKFYEQFYIDAVSYGKQVVGGHLIIEYWDYREAAPNQSSYSFSFMGQWVIRIRNDLDEKYLFTPVYREMARFQLSKPYSDKSDEIMNPTFDPKRLTIDNLDKKLYLDKLFE